LAHIGQVSKAVVMDLTARVTALEEENQLLKGEIKTILQELRTAVLNRDNPFAGGMDSMPMISQRPEVMTPRSMEQPMQDASVAPSGNVVKMFESMPGADLSSQMLSRAFAQQWASAQEPASRAPEEVAATRWSVHSLAALMSWTKEAALRFNPDDLGLILSLARYGRLIDEDLQGTLTQLAKTFAPEELPPPVSSTDYLLALRELDALLDEGNRSSKPVARRVG
jgi:hypothetical protein